MEEPKATPHGEDHEVSESGAGDAALVALLRLLTREPPSDHDFTTCPLCTQHGIEKI